MDKAKFDEAADRIIAARSPIVMHVGNVEKYPIATQKDAQDAWDLRTHGKGVTEDQVVAHIRAAVAKLGLEMPKDKTDTEKAALADHTPLYGLRPHGFQYPEGMPACGVCGEGANTGAHVNPPRMSAVGLNDPSWGILVRSSAADHTPARKPRRTHVYAFGGAGASAKNVQCQACQQPMSASCHSPGMPCGPMGSTIGPGVSVTPQRAADGSNLDDSVVTDAGTGQGPLEGYGAIVMKAHKFEAMEGMSSIGDDYQMCKLCGFPEDDPVHEAGDKGFDADGQAQEPHTVVKQLAWHTVDRLPGCCGDQDANVRPQRAWTPPFVTQLNSKLILTAPAEVFTDPAGLPRELASAWEKASAANPHFMWLEGRYVEADRPNRNMAMWSGDDLELGEPTVAHGPINMLHSERHIVGTIAAASLVKPDRQVAGNEPNTIRALGAIWKYLFPTESRQIAQASNEKKLWYSMECISREVACLGDNCTHTQSYVDYMRAPHTRCPHIKAGGPRRFVDPSFLGGGIIIPPIRPGWAGANATVLRQASQLAERQAASFEGLTTSEAELMVAQIVLYAGGTA